MATRPAYERGCRSRIQHASGSRTLRSDLCHSASVDAEHHCAIAFARLVSFPPPVLLNTPAVPALLALMPSTPIVLPEAAEAFAYTPTPLGALALAPHALRKSRSSVGDSRHASAACAGAVTFHSLACTGRDRGIAEDCNAIAARDSTHTRGFPNV